MQNGSIYKPFKLIHNVRTLPFNLDRLRVFGVVAYWTELIAIGCGGYTRCLICHKIGIKPELE